MAIQDWPAGQERCRRRAGLALALTLLAAVAASAAPRTDVVTLLNGDRITCEVLELKRARLKVKTDDIGTIYIEWDNVAHLEATRQFEVVTANGLRFLGSLGRTPDTSVLTIGGPGGSALPLAVVTSIDPIGASFWQKLDGTFDAGFSYTRSSEIAQLNINSDTAFRRPKAEGRLTVSATMTRDGDDGGRDDRGSLQLSYSRYRRANWFTLVAGQLENNESLGLSLRSQVALATGMRFVNTNRARLLVGGGIVVNNEQGIGTDATQNVEALLALSASYFTYDSPQTDFNMAAQYYPSLSDPGRHRVQLDASLRRDLWKDLYIAVNLYDTYDSRPPVSAENTNDVGVSLTLGWSY